MNVRQLDVPVGEPPPAALAPEPPHGPRREWVWLVVVGLWGAAGIALVSLSFALARANTELDLARILLWGGIAAIVGPALVRMLFASTGRAERIFLVAMAALLLYWIKVLHDPVQLFFADEFFHIANAQRLADTGHLYGENLLLPVSADYPALALDTVALSTLSGLGLFTSALVVIGVAKVLLAVGILLIFERLSGSVRIAGVGALLYCAHSNYVFWSSQFSYESLSVPLLVCALLCVVARTGAARPQRLAWSTAGCVVVAGVAITHHMTSYALAVILWAQVVLTLVLRRPEVRPPLAMATVATLASAAWAVIVAGGTANYLGSIFSRLTGAVSRAVTEEAATRVPFQGSDLAAVGPAVTPTPIDDRLIAVCAVLLVGVGVLAGLLVMRKRKWLDPLVLLLALAAVAAVAAYPLRVFPEAWEISNRTSEFLFLGAAFVAAHAVVVFVDRGRRRWRMPAAAVAGVIAVVGGVVIGWPAVARLPHPVAAKVGDVRLEAQGPRMAEWARTHLPPDATIVANDTDGRLLSIAGFTRVFAGPTPGVTPVLTFDVIPQWVWDFLREEKVDYVVLDRRYVSRDNLVGYFYPRPSHAADPPISNWRNVRRKFERLPGSARIYDSGDIVIYDIRHALERAEPLPDG